MAEDKAFSRVIVFASGAGSGFKRLIDDHASGRMPVSIAALVCNVREAGVVAIARKHAVPVIVVEHQGMSRETHEAVVFESIKSVCGIDLQRDVDVWVVLAGYMRIFSDDFTKRMTVASSGAVRVVNIHPSLLPSFPGVDAYTQAYEHGVKVTGCTVHLLSSKMDDGPIVAQAAITINDGESLASLKARGHALEHDIYGATIARLARGGWTLAAPSGGTRQKVVFT